MQRSERIFVNSVRFVLMTVLFLTELFSISAAGQQSRPPLPPANPPAQNAPQQPESTQSSGTASKSASGQAQTQDEQEIQKKEQSQRILGVVPRFGVTSRQHAPPLTPGQKFHLFVKSSFDPFSFATVGFQAGLSQATNEFPAYGQGAEGYGKRYGAAFADQLSSGFFSNYMYPVLLKEDPRYFRLGEGSVMHRIRYSLLQEFTCRTDKGKRAFNFPNVLGAFSAGTLSNVYYPQSDRGVGLTISRSSIALLYGSAGGLIDEFWPDIDRKLFHKHGQ
jgi:hypothetical protein